MKRFNVVKPVQLAELAGVEAANIYKITSSRGTPIATLKEKSDLKNVLSRNLLTPIREAEFVLAHPDGKQTNYKTTFRNNEFLMEIRPAAEGASVQTIEIEQSIFKKARIGFKNSAGQTETLSLPRLPFWSVFPNWTFRSSGRTIRSIKRRCRSILLYWFTDQDGVYSVDLADSADYELALGVVLTLDLLYFDDNNLAFG